MHQAIDIPALAGNNGRTGLTEDDISGTINILSSGRKKGPGVYLGHARTYPRSTSKVAGHDQGSFCEAKDTFLVPISNHPTKKKGT